MAVTENCTFAQSVTLCWFLLFCFFNSIAGRIGIFNTLNVFSAVHQKSVKNLLSGLTEVGLEQFLCLLVLGLQVEHLWVVFGTGFFK